MIILFLKGAAVGLGIELVFMAVKLVGPFFKSLSKTS